MKRIHSSSVVHGVLAGLAAAALLVGCAHNDAAMTADEHRAAAQSEEKKAADDQAKYDPNQRKARIPEDIGENPVLESYNPTDGYRASAQAHIRAAQRHNDAADSIDKFEDKACTGLEATDRASCPLFTAYVDTVEETDHGVKLHIKPDAPESRLLSQMQCHLAYAKAHGFEQASCPLYVHGAMIDGRPNHIIEVHADKKEDAIVLRNQARALFEHSGARASAP